MFTILKQLQGELHDGGVGTGEEKPHKYRKKVVKNHIRFRDLRTSLLREVVQLSPQGFMYSSTAELIFTPPVFGEIEVQDVNIQVS